MGGGEPSRLMAFGNFFAPPWCRSQRLLFIHGYRWQAETPHTHAKFRRCNYFSISRRQDAKNHLERLVELLQDAPAVGSRVKRGSLRQRASCASATPRGRPGALAVALGNLGVVHHEIGDAKQASRFLEAALEAATRCE